MTSEKEREEAKRKAEDKLFGSFALAKKDKEREKKEREAEQNKKK
jgi:hypothetical protein